MNHEKIQIALVEDHTDFRESMSTLLDLSNRFNCLAFPTGVSFIEYLNREKNCPKVILMDINLPEKNGVECTQIIKKLYPESLILMCTVHEDDDKIFSALKAGASGYILKRAAIEEIFSAIDDLLAGGSPMSGIIARRVGESFGPKNRAAENEYCLSARENEILDLLAKGSRLKEISDKLFISINTVRTHIRHIYEKLQVQSRVEALNKTRHNFN